MATAEWFRLLALRAMNPSTECRKMAELLRETAKQDRVTKVPQARNMHELATKSS
jgi:hypothetical protein